MAEKTEPSGANFAGEAACKWFLKRVETGLESTSASGMWNGTSIFETGK